MVHRWKQRVLNGTTVLVTILAILAAAWRIQINGTGPSMAPPIEVTRQASWRAIASGGIRIGPDTASVTLVEFLDYACSICAAAADYVNEVPSRFQGQVAVVVRHAPFLGPLSVESAIAADCAESLGAFESFHRLLFAHRKEIGTRTWVSFAAEAGIADTLSFQQCLTSVGASVTVAGDTLLAKRLGITAVPTFLINDRRLAGYHGTAVLDSLLQVALAEVKQSSR